MHVYFILVAACLAVVYGYPKPDHQLNNRIVGGNDAPPGKYTYQVSLRFSGRHFCGGSIINKRTILTVAHCLTNYKTRSSLAVLTIHVGTYLLSEYGRVYQADRVIIHDGYNPGNDINDIALIILSSAINYDALVQAIPLATTDVPAGYPCTLSGWGKTQVDGPIPNKLQHIELTVYDQYKCQQIIGSLSSQICTFTKVGKGVCYGDSGSPIVADGVQIGIVSLGFPCAKGLPDVHTRVTAFQDWLQAHIFADTK